MLVYSHDEMTAYNSLRPQRSMPDRLLSVGGLASWGVTGKRRTPGPRLPVISREASIVATGGWKQD